VITGAASTVRKLYARSTERLIHAGCWIRTSENPPTRTLVNKAWMASGLAKSLLSCFTSESVKGDGDVNILMGIHAHTDSFYKVTPISVRRWRCLRSGRQITSKALFL
jgi:hypothetical protein